MKLFLYRSAIVSVTEQLLNQKCTESAYEAEIDTLKLGITRLNSQHTSPDDQISYEEDLRLTLLRHWTTYNSLIYSPYVSNRLHVWKESGRRRLEMLLAKMGYVLFLS